MHIKKIAIMCILYILLEVKSIISVITIACFAKKKIKQQNSFNRNSGQLQTLDVHFYKTITNLYKYYF